MASRRDVRLERVRACVPCRAGLLSARACSASRPGRNTDRRVGGASRIPASASASLLPALWSTPFACGAGAEAAAKSRPQVTQSIGAPDGWRMSGTCKASRAGEVLQPICSGDEARSLVLNAQTHPAIGTGVGQHGPAFQHQLAHVRRGAGSDCRRRGLLGGAHCEKEQVFLWEIDIIVMGRARVFQKPRSTEIRIGAIARGHRPLTS